MASDLLSKISSELDARLGELRPLVAEYERLLVAARSLENTDGSTGTPARASSAKRSPTGRSTGRRGSAAGTVKRAASKPARKRQSASLSTVGRAVLDALEHGSHTISELVMVTAMGAGEIRANVRRLLAHDEIAKIDREGKTAYALPGKK
jgi:hypothetical protein